jgi:uracil-DNA glycosylase
MAMNCHQKISDSDWPKEVAFLPFIGLKYEDGIDGARVLLLGESHYRASGVDNAPEVTREFTRREFADRILPKRSPGVGRYFPPLDRLLTAKFNPTPEESAAKWDRVAFINLAQQFAGTRPGDRPTTTQFFHGSRILTQYVLPSLRPDIVLVLGQRAWMGLATGTLRADLAPYDATGVRRRHERSREIWALPYHGGSALMTWVYHPSRGIDCWTDLAGSLNYLFSLHRNEKSKSNLSKPIA